MKPVPGRNSRPSFAAPRPAGVSLQVADGFADGGVVGFGDLAADRGAAERPGQRDRLRRREGEVEAGDRFSVGRGLQAERIAAGRVAAGQHEDQLLALDLAVEAEELGAVAEPVALGLALAGVVVLGAFGDFAQVVALLAGAELADREHQRRPRRVWISGRSAFTPSLSDPEGQRPRISGRPAPGGVSTAKNIDT